jgi:nucleoside-diphosphate-sugar epimerase
VKLLILGGTVFLGRHIVETARQRGHEITLFTRGERNPDLFPDVEKLRGNRDGGLAPLEGRRWDAVIDTSGYVPRVVRASAELLKDAVAHYTFISSISVYAGFETPNMDETATVGTLPGEGVEEITGETYGPLKALCERAVEDVIPGRALIIRPGLIVGPHDPTNRFTYWPRRVARGGEVLAPDRPDRAAQFIDARDLADWIVRMVEAGATGVYNATGPAERLAMGHLLDVCNAAGGGSATFTWVPERFLLDAAIGPWIELPLWVPETEGAGFSSVSITKALAAGLTFRPLDVTVRDTLAWDVGRPAGTEYRAGLDAEKERETLRRWHATS